MRGYVPDVEIGLLNMVMSTHPARCRTLRQLFTLLTSSTKKFLILSITQSLKKADLIIAINFEIFKLFDGEVYRHWHMMKHSKSSFSNSVSFWLVERRFGSFFRGKFE